MKGRRREGEEGGREGGRERREGGREGGREGEKEIREGERSYIHCYTFRRTPHHKHVPLTCVPC